MIHTGIPAESPVLSNGHAGFGGAGRGNGSPETATPRPGPTLHLPMDRRGAHALFQVVDRRNQAGNSICLTTNRSFASWGEIFEDDTVAAAILDRLLGNAVVINIRGESYRMRTTAACSRRPARG